VEENKPEDIFFESLMEKRAEEPKKKETPSPQKTITSKSLFSHPDTHPVVLDLALLKQFKLEWFSWLPETLFSEIERSFGTSIAEVNRLKILAAQTLHVTDVFWEAWEVFEKTIMALNGVIPIPSTIQPPDLSLLFAGIDIAKGIRVEKFSDEVASYCAAIFLFENVHYAPEPLSFCQEYITQPMYECKDCGKKGSALPPFDGLCSSCAGHFEHAHPFSFSPDPEALKRGSGKNISFYKTFDPDSIKTRFEELDKAANPSEMICETHEDIQAAKLIVAVDFMKYRDQQFKTQLGSLRGWLEMA
jgi:hypothetical protein